MKKGKRKATERKSSGQNSKPTGDENAPPTRLAVYVAPQLFRRAKVAAAMEGTTLSALVTEALEALLATRRA